MMMRWAVDVARRTLTYSMASSSDTALKTFSLRNDIKEISPQDEIYKYDAEANRRLMREQPWTSE
jgi:COP9 signalosome complex subunit 5